MPRFLKRSSLQKETIFCCLLASIVFLTAIAGCSGGGGTGSDYIPGPATQIMSNNSFHFTAARNAPLPVSQSTSPILMGIDKLELRAAYDDMPGWLDARFRHTATSVDLVFTIRTTDLPLGTYNARFQLVAVDDHILGDRDSGYQDITVTYQVVAIEASAQELLFRMVEDGDQLPDADRITLYGDAISWQAVSSVPWLDIIPAGGSTVTGDITIAVNSEARNLTTGLYTGIVSASAGGYTSSVTVTLQIDPRRISAVHNGIALSSFPSGGRLAQTAQILDNALALGAWTASDDADWLQLEPVSGTSGDTLLLTADPSGLANGIHHATVTLSAQSNPSSESGGTIRVGLYVSDQDADPITTIPNTVSRVAIDPIRPYVYGIDYEGLAVRIVGYNVYSGEALSPWDTGINEPAPGRRFRSVVPSSDGSRLFVVHSDYYDETDQKILTMDLDTGVILSSIPITKEGMTSQCNGPCNIEEFTSAIYVRQDDNEVLITNNLEIIDLQTGHTLLQFEDETDRVMFRDSWRPVVQVSPNGRYLYYQARDGYSTEYDDLLIRFGLTLSGISGTAPIVEMLDVLNVNTGGVQRRLIQNRSGDIICSRGRTTTCFDEALNPGHTLTPPVDRGAFRTVLLNFQNELLVGFDTYPDLGEADIDVYDTSMILVDSYDTPGFLDGLLLSADGRRLVVFHDDGDEISFVDIN